MKLQPVPIDDIPLGKPLQWRLYDRSGYIVYARGEIVYDRAQLESHLSKGLFKDRDALLQAREPLDLVEFNEIEPASLFPPAGIKPQIAERVQLRQLEENSPCYFSARLIGYIKNLSILVTRPASAKNPFIPVEGKALEVRMVTGCNIYTFRSSIQRLCVSPADYMHLEYPTQVHVHKLRKSPWAMVNLGVTVTDPQGAREAARLVNLSPDGGQLHASPTLGKPGESLRLFFHATLDELKTTLNLEATILHVHAPQAVDLNLQ